MNHFIRSVLLLIQILVFSYPVFAAKVTATVDATNINKSDIFTFKIEAEGVDTSPKVDITPILNAFSIVSGPSQQTNISWVNGKMKSSRNLTWTLSPSKTGILTIPSLKVMFGKKTFRTKPIKIKVSQGKALSTSGDLFLTSEIDKSEVYPGEQITVTYKIYTKVNISIEDLELPKFVGFWTEELFAPNRIEFRKVNLKGVSYNVARIYTVALFPTKSTDLYLDPMKVKCNVAVKSKGRRRSIWDDPFFDTFNRQKTVTKLLQTEKTQIKIKSFPAGKPTDYSGAVGSFTLTSSVDMNSVKLNEAITLSIHLNGSGNISMFSLPEFQFPNSFEVFPPTSTIKKEPFRDNITGSVNWEYILIPRQEGKFTLPSVTLPYFYPQSKQWKIASTTPIRVTVLPGDKRELVATGLTKQEVELLSSDIRYTRREIPKWIDKNSKGTALQFVTLYSLAFLLFLSPRFANIFQNNQLGTAEIRRSKKALKFSENTLKFPSDNVYSHVSKVLYHYIKDKFSLSTDNLDPLTVYSLLKGKVQEKDLDSLVHILKTCDSGQYAPGENLNKENFITNVRKLLNRIDKNA